MLGVARTTLIATCIMMMCLAALVFFWSSTHRGDGQEPPRPQAFEDSLTGAARGRRHAFRWANVAVLFCNLNYCIVFPSGAQGMPHVLGSFTAAGLWVGLYAVGALFALPVFMLAGVRQTKSALVLHGVSVFVGNGLMLAAMHSGLVWPIFLGRGICGMEAGIKYFADNLNSYLTSPGKERLRAMFSTRMATATGNAAGFFVPPFLQWLVLNAMPHGYINTIIPISSLRSEALCAAFMLVYAVAFLLGVLALFESPEPLEEGKEGKGGAEARQATAGRQGEDHQQAVWRAASLFSATIFTNFTRIFITFAWKSGSLFVLSHSYCIATVASIVICIVELGLLLCRNVLDALSKHTSDIAVLQRTLEMIGLVAVALMFRIGSATPASLSLYLVTSFVFYAANTCQSGVMQTISTDAAIAEHSYLNKKMLNVYCFIAHVTTWLLAPAATSALMQVSLHQNTLAALLVALTVIQVLITFTHVRPKTG